MDTGRMETGRDGGNNGGGNPIGFMMDTKPKYWIF